MKEKQRKKRTIRQLIANLLVFCITLTLQPLTNEAARSDSNEPEVEAATITESSTTTSSGADTFSWDNATVYFLLTDRFNNGDTTNDHSYNRGLDQNGNVISYSDTSATFHGGDFAGITDKIEDGYFDDLGVNALWISAPYEQIHGYVVGSDDSESFPHYAYHGYYTLDYTETDENFGTAEEFQELVDTAHEHGIRIVLDVVMNHAGYNTLYDMDEYNFGTLQSGWEDAYYVSSGINNTTYHSYIDYTSSSSDWSSWWGTDWIRCGVAGYDAGGSTNLLMSLSGLPDFKTESTSTVGIPNILQTKWNQEGRYEEEYSELTSYLSEHNMSMTVTNVLTYWLQSWVREYGVDGFHCDTAKHVDLSSWATLKSACVEALDDWKTENPDKALDDSDFWMTGEVWDHGVYKDEYYTEGGFDSIINFSTQGGGILSSDQVAGTYQSFADSINSDPDFNVLSYISSHDSVLTRGNSIYMGSAFLMLPGGVQIFYGDETDREVDSSASTNGDHEVRSDMNWDDMNETTLVHWQKVGSFRNNHIAVGAGANASLDASDGVAFSRVYDSDGISDKIAAVIGCSSNTDVEIDVSSLWEDGQYLVNAYDYTTYIVADGKITVNSGTNGTILMEEPDGKPLLSVTGEAKFYDTETVTIHIEDADYAKVSIDGAKKFLAYDGDTVTIGETAYEGDTISVQVEATNDVGTRTSIGTFYKAYADEDISGGEEEEYEGILYVNADTAPYVYAWTGSSNALCGAWPGTQMTETNSEGYYVMDLGTTASYSVVLNDGNGTQTSDITGLEGGVWLDLTSSYGYTITAREVEATTTPITFYVSSYTGAAPYLYIWDGSGNTYNGSFPGNALTETTSDGYYTLTVDSYSSSVNCIVSYGGNTTQSGNITGITDEVWITIESEDCKSISVVKSENTESYFDTLKSETREIKNMTASDYLSKTWDVLSAYVTPADALIALGEEDAAEEDLIEMIEAIQAAKANLVLAEPVTNGIAEGSTSIYGTAPYESTVSVAIGDNSYTAVADDITGEWSVTTNSLQQTDKIVICATLGTLASCTYTFFTDPETTAVDPVYPSYYKESGEDTYSVTVYYNSSWDTTYMNYQIGSEEWTDAPGVIMTDSSYDGYQMLTIDLGTNTSLNCSFNDGTEETDDNSGLNYALANGVYTIKDQTITTGIPEVEIPETYEVTVYYQSDWDAAYMNYQIADGDWTTTPGIEMSDSTYTGYKVVTVDLGTEESITCAFNNGSDETDDNDGTNYTLNDGIYTIADGMITEGVPTVTETYEVTVYYYTSWSAAYLHYKVGEGSWTTAPGVVMSDTESSSYKTITIEMEEDTTLTCCFNNGSGTWDNNDSSNYSLSAGTYTIKNNTVTEGTPDFNDTTVTIYYATSWSTPYIHYQLGSDSWTTAPGVAMSNSDYSGYYVAVIDLGSETTMNFCFNDGNGTWDNNNSQNYYISGTGTYTISDQTITTGTPE